LHEKPTKRAVVVQDLKDEVMFQMKPMSKQLEELRVQLAQLIQQNTMQGRGQSQPTGQAANRTMVPERMERRNEMNAIRSEIARLERQYEGTNQSEN
jgi:hypothetical protein